MKSPVLSIVMALVFVAFTLAGCGCALTFGNKTCTFPKSVSAECCAATQNFARLIACSSYTDAEYQAATLESASACGNEADMKASVEGQTDPEYQNCVRDAVTSCAR
mmetsp:Transcript_4939/g.8798  ORF Transcript_4939/g.8798 Transcript_4939/m.8798 type:complete len:107 (-) Transcript_4939:10-330(-)